MAIRVRFRLRLLAYVAAVLASGGVVGWTLVRTSRGHEETVLVLELQRLVLERTLLRDEFLVHGEARARAQWHEHTTRIRALLERVRQRPETPDGGAEDDLDSTLRRADVLFARLEAATLPAGGVPPPAPDARAAARARAADDLTLATFETYAEVSRLVELALAREGRRERAALAVVGIVVLGALGTVIAATVATSARTARRIARLDEGAQRIAAGDLDHRIRLPGKDELAALGDSFDAMAEQLLTGVRALEASNRELEAFSYSVSHDLRAPLRQVGAFVDLLAEEAGDRLGPEGERLLAAIRRAAGKLERLIDDLLSFSRVGRTSLSPRPILLRAMIEEIVRDLSDGSSPTARVAWTIGPLPEVTADPALLRLVWMNLLDNALKFSRERPLARIEIGSREGLEEISFFVRDNGAGFDPRFGGRLFGVFQRLHPQERFEGSGIGLANVQRIVHRHGGRVWAESRPDEGATFWFSLPRQLAAPRTARRGLARAATERPGPPAGDGGGGGDDAQ